MGNSSPTLATGKPRENLAPDSTKSKESQLSFIVRLLVVVAFASLYAWGGIEHKWLRRFLAPAIYTLAYVCYTRDWKASMLLCLAAPLHLGYGASSTALKIILRLSCGLGCGLAANSYIIYQALKDKPIRAAWVTLAAFGIVLSIATSIVFGVFSLIPARAEELLLGVVYVLTPMLGAHWKRQ